VKASRSEAKEASESLSKVSQLPEFLVVKRSFLTSHVGICTGARQSDSIECSSELVGRKEHPTPTGLLLLSYHQCGMIALIEVKTLQQERQQSKKQLESLEEVRYKLSSRHK